MSEFRVFQGGKNTLTSWDATTEHNEITHEGDGFFLEEKFSDLDSARNYGSNLLTKDPSLILYILDEEDRIVETILNSEYQEENERKDNLNFAIKLWLSYFVISGVLVYFLFDTTLTIEVIVHLSLGLIYFILLFIFGPRSCIEMGILAVIILLLTLMGEAVFENVLKKAREETQSRLENRPKTSSFII